MGNLECYNVIRILRTVASLLIASGHLSSADTNPRILENTIYPITLKKPSSTVHFHRLLDKKRFYISNFQLPRQKTLETLNNFPSYSNTLTNSELKLIWIKSNGRLVTNGKLQHKFSAFFIVTVENKNNQHNKKFGQHENT